MKIEVSNLLEAARLLEVDPGKLAHALALVDEQKPKNITVAGAIPKQRKKKAPAPEAKKTKIKARKGKKATKRGGKVRQWDLANPEEKKELEAFMVEALKKASKAINLSDILSHVWDKAGRMPTVNQGRAVINKLIEDGKVKRYGQRKNTTYAA